MGEAPPGQTQKEKETAYYADAWGIRKLMSHTLRNLRVERLPRAPGLQIFLCFGGTVGYHLIHVVSCDKCEVAALRLRRSAV